jgi:S1-C subfamily serine protease
VLDVSPGSGAARAGIRPTRRDSVGRMVLGDVIVAIDDKPVGDANELRDRLEAHKPGETVTVGVLRNGKRQELRVTVEALSEDQ